MSGSRIYLRSGVYVDVEMSPPRLHELLKVTAQPTYGGRGILVLRADNGEISHVLAVDAIEAVVPR